MAGCRHIETITEDGGGPRNPWHGYTYCVRCGESVGIKWKRMIDDLCEREWKFRPHKTKPISGGASD